MTLETLTEAVKGGAAAIRIVTRLEPVGHERDKVFPPTYAGGEYALEDRYPAAAANVSSDGNGAQPKGDEGPVRAVLLHSVAGEANLLEEALKAAIADGRVTGVPVLKVSFDGTAAAEYLHESITVLVAPHRVFDAIFRDSEVPSTNGNPAKGFSETDPEKRLQRPRWQTPHRFTSGVPRRFCLVAGTRPTTRFPARSKAISNSLGPLCQKSLVMKLSKA
jgi:hypothetical protein